MHINHTALVTDITSSHCISHSVTEGFNFPTCRNTKLWNGIYLVVRCSNNEIASNAVSICKKWCSGAELIDQETYLKRYAHHRWNDRRTRDLKTFKHAEKVATQCNIYAEPRATNDIREADKNPSIKSMTETSIVRAIKFSSRRNLTCRISKGFRCTPLVVSAWQAAVLSPIATPTQEVVKFKSIKTMEGCKEYLVKDWEETEEGRLLLEQEYDELFLDGAFLIDSRFALPKDLFGRLEYSSKFSFVGMFSYYNKSVVANTLFE